MLTMAYAFLFLFALIVIIKYIKSGKRFVSTTFMAVFSIYYIMVPGILSIYSIEQDVNSYSAPHLVVISRMDYSDKIIVFAITLVVFLLLVLFNSVKFTFNRGKDRKKSYQFREYIDVNQLNKKLFCLGLLFTAIGTFCILELAFELGGIKSMLGLASTIRGYRIDNAEYISPIGAMCKTMSIFSTGGFFCIYASRKREKRHWFFLIFSFSISVLYLLFNAGRAPMLLFFGCIVFAVFRERRIKILWMVIVAFLLIVFSSSTIEVVMRNISIGMPMFNNVQYSLSENVLATMADFAYPYANVLSLSELTTMYGYNYSLDYFTWIFEILPSRMFSMFRIGIPQITLVTTKVSRYYIDSGLSLGGTPADFITYGWFQGCVVGLTINCLIYSILLRKIDDILEKLPLNYSVIDVRMCFFAYSLVTSNDFALVIKNNLFLIIIILVLHKLTLNKQSVWEEKNARNSRKYS